MLFKEVSGPRISGYSTLWKWLGLTGWTLLVIWLTACSSMPPVVKVTLPCLDHPPPLLSPAAKRSPCPENSGLSVCLSHDAAVAVASWISATLSWEREAYARCGAAPTPAPAVPSTTPTLHRRGPNVMTARIQ